MSCDRGLGLKTGRFWVYLYWEMENRAGFWRVHVWKYETGRVFHVLLIGDNEIGCVFGGYMCGNVKPAKFFIYPCRGVLHTPRNNPRQRFGSKTGQVLRHVVCGNMKPVKFCTYPCSGATAYAPKCPATMVWVSNRVRFGLIRVRRYETRQILCVPV